MPDASTIVLGERPLRVGDVIAVARDGAAVEVGAAARERVARSRAVVERIAAGEQPVYGLTTGLGPKAGMRLEPAEREAFQSRVLLGRATSAGAPYPRDVVRAMLLARAAGLANGGAGASPAVLDALLALLAHGVHPVVPALGSAGVSDLALCAALALPLVGLGEAELDGVRLPGDEALRRAALVPLRLGVKDGIALCSANAASVGHGALVAHDAGGLLDTAFAALALSLEGYQGNLSPFHARVAAARPATGQEAASARVRALLRGSALERAGTARQLQDPLSFRCAAPVLGAAASAVAAVETAVEVELAGAGDNPLVLADHGEMLSTGNFDSIALALACEGACLALAQVGLASTQRTQRLLEPRRGGLPLGLSEEGDGAGLGPLGLPLTAAWSEVRLLAAPATLDGLPLADGVEDHAPGTPFVVAKLARLLDRLALVLAIELMVAAQAVDLRGRPLEAPAVARLHAEVRTTSARLREDRPLGGELEQLAARVRAGDLAP